MDDTIATDAQSREDAYFASMRMLPNHMFLEIASPEELPEVYAKCEAAVETGGVCLFAIPRRAAEAGLRGGAVIGRVLAGMPASVHGKVILTFRDWANDPRELCEIAEVIDFCNGLIYGHEPMSNPDPAHPAMARSVLPVLLDESTFGDQPVWDAVGRNWIVSVAHASVCFTQRNGRWLRDVGLADNLIRVFLGVEG